LYDTVRPVTSNPTALIVELSMDTATLSQVGLDECIAVAHLCRCALEESLSFDEHMDAIAHVEDELDVVVDEEDADAAVAHESDVVGELADLTLVESRGWFVEEYIGRVGRQGTCHAYATLDSVRQRGRRPVCPLAEVELGNETVGSFTSGLRPLAGADRGDGDVLADREAVEQVPVLKRARQAVARS
jgi:hypothetical protein